MKTYRILTLLFGLLVLGSVACSQIPLNESEIEASSMGIDEMITEKVEALSSNPEPGESFEVNLEFQASSAATSRLSAEEIDGLIFMREEEKLARDVYLFLNDLWGQKIFSNIAGSEQTHTDAVLNLLVQFGLDDPADGLGQGVFQDPELQSLYDELVSKGSQSLADALEVGAIIEEVDILDLEERIAQTTNEAILVVYQNLLRGSENHLRAFVLNLDRKAGLHYEPQFLDLTSFLAIVK